MPRHWISFQLKSSTNTLLHSWQQSSRQSSASSHIWWSCGWTNEPSQVPWEPLWQNADLQTICMTTTVLRCRKALSVLKAVSVRRVSNDVTLFVVLECGTQWHWQWSRPHSNVTDKSAEAGQSAKWGYEHHTGNHYGHTCWDQMVHARPPTNAI